MSQATLAEHYLWVAVGAAMVIVVIAMVAGTLRAIEDEPAS